MSIPLITDESESALQEDWSDEAVEAAVLADEKIQKDIEGKTVRKVIVVPNRLVNVGG